MIGKSIDEASRHGHRAGVTSENKSLGAVMERLAESNEGKVSEIQRAFSSQEMKYDKECKRAIGQKAPTFQ